MPRPPPKAADEGPPGRAKAPAAAPLTAERIRNIAEHYVGQRESSARMLRAVLERRLFRRLRGLSPEAAEEERAAALPLIEAEVARLVQLGARRLGDGELADPDGNEVVVRAQR